MLKFEKLFRNKLSEIQIMKNDIHASLPDRNSSEIPENVQWLLSICEMTSIYRHWLDKNMNTEADQFCNGLSDYWWDYEVLDEPHFGMLSAVEKQNNERVAYQNGAIIGYELADLYKHLGEK